jgi:hypothetical protein
MKIRNYSSNEVQYYVHKLTLLLIMGELRTMISPNIIYINSLFFNY